MSKPAIRIEAVHVEELEAFAARAQDLAGILPITPRRAQSHAANPNAVPSEVALLVAYDGERCIGYLGIMAGVLHHDGAVQRFHWFSSWYVDPAYAKSGAGTMLLMRAIGLKYDLAVTGTSPEADAMYRALRFKELTPLQYEEVFLDALDPLGFPFFALGKWLEKRGRPAGVVYRIARTVRPILQPLLKRVVYATLRPRAGGLNVARQTDVYEEFTPPNSAPMFYRDPDTVNWMLATPWFTENQADAVKDYYFNDHRSLFRYTCLRFEVDGEPVGNAVLSAARKADRTIVKVLDCSFTEAEYRHTLLPHVFAFAARYRADRILFPANFKTVLQLLPIFGRITFTRTRNYFCRPKKKDSVLTPVLDTVQLQLTDGDCAFS